MQERCDTLYRLLKKHGLAAENFRPEV